MALLGGRFLVSAESPATVDGFYYWQHSFYVDDADFANHAQMALAVFNDMKLFYTTQVGFHAQRYYVPGTEDLVFEQTFSFPFFGALSAVDNPSLLMCARWRMFGTDGSYSYHLHRQPIGEDYLENGGWSALGMTQSQTRLNTFIGQSIYRTHTGALIASGLVSSVPVMWQLRHGTKRRERHGWL